jgi:threonine synthase
MGAPFLFRSSRAQSAPCSFSDAVLKGLAPDGGLYVPLQWPQLETSAFRASLALPQVAQSWLAPFLAGDPLAGNLAEIAQEALNFEAPLVRPDSQQNLEVLELFHGPTAAFKDFGARFLASCFARLHAPARTLTILVATSGDTGGAVAAAFHGRPGVEVAILFPKGLVSPTQERQLTCWGGNVRSLRVRGTFDDCQRLVKAAFVDPALSAQRDLSSANSINLGRLLPQSVYYAASSLAIWRASGQRASYVVPSGNLGNALACLWARQVGLPIGEVVLAHNANRTVPDFLANGQWQPRASLPTLASAMDVGNPSNMERLRSLFPELDSLRTAVRAVSVTDDEIRARIRAGYQDYGQVWCPHTAAGAEAWARLPEARRRAGPWVLVATAHPAKFREIVEPLIDRSVQVPASLAQLFARPSSCVEIDATLAALRGELTREE